MTDTDTPTHPPRWIEYLPLTDLQPHPDNPKGHVLDDLAAAVARFNFTEPVMVCERTGYLASGHGRRETLLRLVSEGGTRPEGIEIDPDTGQWLVPVVRGWSSKDDAELRAWLFTGNHLARVGGWVPDLLDPILREMAEANALVGTGLTHDTLDDLLAEIGSGVLDPGPTDAAYADQTPRGEPAVPRQMQGLHDVTLTFQAANHRDYLSLLAQLRDRWDREMPSPLVVLRAMRQALDAENDG